MKVTSPYEINDNQQEMLENIVNKFERELKTMKLVGNKFTIEIHRETNDIICEKIKQIYLDAGWKEVECISTKFQGRYNEIEYRTKLTLIK